jgi:hypothetical protein
MGNRPSRDQSRLQEEVTNTRQDRNTILTGGGTWAWNAGTGTLTWSANAYLSRGAKLVDTVTGPGSQINLGNAGKCAYVIVDRSSGGGILAVGQAYMTNALFNDDSVVVLGYRGSDDKFYFRNGTVMSDGDSKAFGMLNSVTDRDDVVADGNALQTIGFNYVMTSGQLAVYVGGMLQTLGTHYTETAVNQVTFTAGHIPVEDELISFVNIIGGEGPAGTSGSLQDAYDEGTNVEVVSGFPVHLWSATVGATVLSIGDGPYPGSTQNITFRSNRGILMQSGGVPGSNRGLRIEDNAAVSFFDFFPVDDGQDDFVAIYRRWGHAIRMYGGGEGLEFGVYSGAYPAGPGAWTGDGPLRWKIYTGTIDGAGASEAIPTGITSIQGLILAVRDNGVPGGWYVAQSNTVPDASRYLMSRYNAAGDIEILGRVTSPTIGASFWGQPYTLIVLHQG